MVGAVSHKLITLQTNVTRSAETGHTVIASISKNDGTGCFISDALIGLSKGFIVVTGPNEVVFSAQES